jgi:hypothetical protein
MSSHIRTCLEVPYIDSEPVSEYCTSEDHLKHKASNNNVQNSTLPLFRLGMLCRGIEPSRDSTQRRGSNRSAKSTMVIVRLIARLCTRAGPGCEADPLRTTSPPT